MICLRFSSVHFSFISSSWNRNALLVQHHHTSVQSLLSFLGCLDVHFSLENEKREWCMTILLSQYKLHSYNINYKFIRTLWTPQKKIRKLKEQHLQYVDIRWVGTLKWQQYSRPKNLCRNENVDNTMHLTRLYHHYGMFWVHEYSNLP